MPQARQRGGFKQCKVPKAPTLKSGEADCSRAMTPPPAQQAAGLMQSSPGLSWSNGFSKCWLPLAQCCILTLKKMWPLARAGHLQANKIPSIQMAPPFPGAIWHSATLQTTGQGYP